MAILARLRPYVLSSDTPVAPPDRNACGWDDLCQWDEVPHPDMVRPVIVQLNDDAYRGDLGRMCAVHYRAVLEGRAMHAQPRRLEFLILTQPARDIVSLSLREGVDFLDEPWPEFGEFYVLETA